MNDNTPPEALDPAFIILGGGIAATSHTETASGNQHHPGDAGKFMFFVSVTFNDGSTLGLWSGLDYEQAKRQAEWNRIEWEIDEPVHDQVAGGAS